MNPIPGPLFPRRAMLLLVVFLVAGTVFGQETFRIMHYETSALAASWSWAAEKFQASHPGVKVEVTVKTFDEVNSTLDRILGSNEVPDVMEFNKGNATAGYWAAKGGLRNLTADALKFGWDRLLPGTLQTTARYDSQGRMGTGAWYGVSPYAEFVVVFYNRALLRKAGVGLPTTRAEFEASLAALKGAGILPLTLGAANHPAQHLLYELYLSRASRQEVDDFQGYRAPVEFTSGAWRDAAETLARWGAAGYFSPGATTLDDEGMLAEFRAGKAAFMVSGTWFFPRLEAEAKDLDWGAMLFPGNKLHPGSGGNLWVVPARSRHADWAVEFINLTLDRDAQNVLANRGGLAVAADASAISSPRAADLSRAFSRVLASDALAFYPDWPALGYYDSLVAAARDLLRGVAPDRVLQGLDLAYRTKKGRF